MRLRCVILVASLAALSPALAGAGAPDEREADVPVYTNADLARFGSLEVTDPVGGYDDGDWELVNDFLAREHQRLETDRRYELDRERDETRCSRDESRRRYAYPYLGLGYGTLGRAVGRHHAGDRPRAEDARRVLGAPIVPLHARPSQAQIMRSKAIRLSGIDAVPSRSRTGR